MSVAALRLPSETGVDPAQTKGTLRGAESVQHTKLLLLPNSGAPPVSSFSCWYHGPASQHGTKASNYLMLPHHVQLLILLMV